MAAAIAVCLVGMVLSKRLHLCDVCDSLREMKSVIEHNDSSAHEYAYISIAF